MDVPVLYNNQRVVFNIKEMITGLLFTYNGMAEVACYGRT